MSALVHGHSGLRWVALILLVVAIFRALSRMKSGKYEKSDKMINLFAMVMIHVQVTLGAILAFTSGKVAYVEGWMKNPQYRFFGLEHILLMVLAAVLLTIGRKKAEKQADLAKRHKTIAIWYTIGLLLILAGIPWPFRELLQAKWF
jgi:high-affinity Fe2+/Pb2+ permease